MDVKNVFLHGDSDEIIYMEQPFGYINNNHPDHVYLLKKIFVWIKIIS